MPWILFSLLWFDIPAIVFWVKWLWYFSFGKFFPLTLSSFFGAKWRLHHPSPLKIIWNCFFSASIFFFPFCFIYCFDMALLFCSPILSCPVPRGGVVAKLHAMGTLGSSQSLHMERTQVPSGSPSVCTGYFASAHWRCSLYFSAQYIALDLAEQGSASPIPSFLSSPLPTQKYLPACSDRLYNLWLFHWPKWHQHWASAGGPYKCALWHIYNTPWMYIQCRRMSGLGS